MADRALRSLLAAALGAYVGALLVPAAAAVGGSAALPAATLAGAVVGALAVVAVGSGDSHPALRSLPWAASLFALPAGYGAAFAAAEAGVTRAVPVTPLALLAGALGGGVAAGVVVVVAAVRHARHVRATATVDARFEARRSPEQRHRQKHLGVILLLVGAVAGVGSVFLLGGPTGYAYLGLVGAGVAVAGGADQSREFAVTDAGLVTGGAVRPWSAYGAVGREEDAVVLRAAGWRGDETFDRADLDETHVAALERRVTGRS